jgi:hypothetical protein
LEGLSLRCPGDKEHPAGLARFPFLSGRAFIEASPLAPTTGNPIHFPSFSEGLSLRPIRREQREQREGILRFQAETFIEASPWLLKPAPSPRFLRFLAETFIEACRRVERSMRCWDFPSFWEGLSLRLACGNRYGEGEG